MLAVEDDVLELLTQQATELADEVQSVQLHPRYAALIVEEPFGLPVVIGGTTRHHHGAGPLRTRAPVVSRRARGGSQRYP
jgi:hypothetical protein